MTPFLKVLAKYKREETRLKYFSKHLVIGKI